MIGFFVGSYFFIVLGFWKSEYENEILNFLVLIYGVIDLLD